MAASQLFYLLGALYSASLSGGTLFLTPRSMEKKPMVCETEACTKRAQLIKESIDKSKDPCEDFYSYVCGKTTTETQGEGAESTHMDELREKLVEKMKMMLDKLPNVTEPKDSMEMAALAYQVCMYNDFSLQDEIKATKMFLSKRGWSGWPIIKGQESGGKRFNTFEEFLLTVSLDSVLTVGLFGKTGDKKGFMIKLGPMNTWMTNHEMYSEIHDSMNPMNTTDAAEQILESRSSEMKLNDTGDANTLLGEALIATAALFKNASKEELKEVYTKTIMFFKVLNKFSKEGDKTNIKVKTIKEVETAFPGFPLLRSLNKYLEPVDVIMKEDSMVAMENFEVIDATMKFYMKKEPDDIFNSIGMENVFDYMYSTSEEFRQMEVMKVYRKAVGETGPRAYFCWSVVSGGLRDLVQKTYLKKVFDPETKPAARKVLNAIGKAYYQRLAHISWMDHMTWRKASSQLWNMNPHVAFPKEEIREPMMDLLDKNITKFGRNDAYIRVFEAIFERFFLQKFSRLSKDSYTTRSFYEQSLTNYGYDPSDNSLGFSAGVLQGYYFHKDLPMCVNLAGIGILMAHEMTNGLFYKGRIIGGAIDNGWNKYSRDAFMEKGKCFVNQYGSICEPLTMMKLNGEVTKHINIADLAALKIAFEALRSNLKDSADYALPGLEKLTPEQLFFISYALPMCTNVTSGSLKKQIMNSPMAPNKYRVNVPLKNSLEFSAAFNCKRKSKMRLPDTERCDIW